MRHFMDKKLVLATHNKGKLAEFRDLLAPFGVDVLSAGDLGLDEPEETGATFEENAILKARAAALATGLPALADDSGLCVAALGGDPGLYSARWAGPNKDFTMAMQLIHEKIGSNPNRSGAFVCVLALVWPDGHTESVEGRCEGTIIWPMRGDKGHGYDPFFVPAGETRTFAEMDSGEKHAQSHRGRALAALSVLFGKA